MQSAWHPVTIPRCALSILEIWENNLAINCVQLNAEYADRHNRIQIPIIHLSAIALPFDVNKIAPAITGAIFFRSLDQVGISKRRTQPAITPVQEWLLNKVMQHGTKDKRRDRVNTKQ